MPPKSGFQMVCFYSVRNIRILAFSPIIQAAKNKCRQAKKKILLYLHKLRTGDDKMEKTRDVNSKVIFHDPILCSQFLRDNIDIPLLKSVKPEDIEDVSVRYQSYLGTEFEADTVKKIHLHGIKEPTSVYLISLIEHKSQVDYNVTIQLLKYMILIWTEYAKEMEREKKGNSTNKNFRYPPILPIVYYEGADHWTVDLHLKDRIFMNEIFGEFIPDFTYRLIRIHDYSNEELLSREDEISLLMMINKVQTAEDFKDFLASQNEQINAIIQKTPERILQIIADTIWGLCRKMNVPEQETRQCIEKVRGRQMGYLFENMEKMDIQAERQNTQDALEKLRQAEQKAQQAEKKAKQKIEQIEQEKQQEEQKAQLAEQEKQQVEQKAEQAQRSIVNLCKKYGGTKEEAIQILERDYEMTKEQAAEIVDLYW